MGREGAGASLLMLTPLIHPRGPEVKAPLVSGVGRSGVSQLREKNIERGKQLHDETQSSPCMMKHFPAFLLGEILGKRREEMRDSETGLLNMCKCASAFLKLIS